MKTFAFPQIQDFLNERLWSFFQVETENVAYGGRYDGREDFAVVVQPFFQNTVVPLNAVRHAL